MHGIQHSFGIIGSAFMPISDLFPKAGITFWDVAHESNGGLIADGYTRSTGKIEGTQNGPGITGLVTQKTHVESHPNAFSYSSTVSKQWDKVAFRKLNK